MTEFLNKGSVNDNSISSIRSQNISEIVKANTIFDTFWNRVENNLLHLIGINH